MIYWSLCISTKTLSTFSSGSNCGDSTCYSIINIVIYSQSCYQLLICLLGIHLQMPFLELVSTSPLPMKPASCLIPLAYMFMDSQVHLVPTSFKLAANAPSVNVCSSLISIMSASSCSLSFILRYSAYLF